MAGRVRHYRKVIVHMIDEMPTALIGRMMMEMGDDIRRKQWLTKDGVVEMNREPEDNHVNFNVRVVRKVLR